MNSNFRQRQSNRAGGNRHHVLGEVNVGKNRDMLIEVKDTPDGQMLSLVQRITIDADIPMRPQYRELAALSPSGLLDLIGLLTEDALYEKLERLQEGAQVEAVSTYES